MPMIGSGCWVHFSFSHSRRRSHRDEQRASRTTSRVLSSLAGGAAQRFAPHRPRLSGCMALIPALCGEPDRTPGCKAHAHRSDRRRSHSVPSACRNRARGVDRHSQLPSGRGQKLLLFVADREPGAALHSVPRCCASLRRKKPNELSVTSNRKRWRPFWRSPIERLYWGNATTHCWASSITPERAFRRHWTFAPTISTLSHRLTSGFSGRAARNGSARCGPKPQTCYWPSCTGDPRSPDEPIFCNRYGRKLGASGVRFQLRRYVNSARKKIPHLSSKKISPHTFRHTTAVHLIAAGVDVTVIRSWLGHTHLDTTNHYAQADLKTKRAALEQVTSESPPSKPPRWKRDQDLLGWLNSL